MINVLQRISDPREAAQFAVASEREDDARVLHEFLVWLEQTKGLVLCQEFKPKYDWYTLVFANKKNLACEFLGKDRSEIGAHRKPASELAISLMSTQESS